MAEHQQSLDVARITAGTNRLSDASERLARAAKGRPEELRESAEEFEAMFLAQMLAPMFENLGEGSLFGDGPGAGIYRSMLVEEYGKAVAKSGGLGIADAVQKEFLRLQEVEE